MTAHPIPPSQRPSRLGLLRGAHATLPLLIALVPFGLIFGALATDLGLSPFETIAMSATIIAGAAQLAALQLMSEQAPALVVILTGAVINLRNALYSASMATIFEELRLAWRLPMAYFVFDQTYALSTQRAVDLPRESISDRLGFFFGIGLACVTAWMVSCSIGIVLGARLPPEWHLEFLVPVLFLAISAPMIRSRAHIFAATVAILVALLAAGLPYGLGLMFGAAAGIGAGMAIPERAGGEARS